MIGRAEWMTTLRYGWLRMNGKIEDNSELITYGITQLTKLREVENIPQMVLRDKELTMFSEIYIYFVQVYFC